jgi:putative ABC transport system ATP-binding protein
LADEPTGALDQETGREVMEIFSKLNQQGKTIIIVTHDPNIAAKCNRIIKIVDGKIQG